MTSRKKPRPRSRSTTSPTRIKILVGVMIVVLVAGIAAVKYFQTPRGRATLLDAGFGGYYAQVQETLGESLRAALGRAGLSGRVDEKAVRAKQQGRTVRVLAWDVECGESTNLVRLNLALTRAVQKAGGRVRRSEEIEAGRALRFVVGSGRFDTHRLVLRKGGPVATPPGTALPKLALVIDDMGYSRDGVVKDLLESDLPLTISVLPSLPYSTYALRRAQELGKCTILHLPMEPDEDQGSDNEMVTTAMDDETIERLVERYLQSLPGIQGVNNHQGSRATADERVMRAVLGVIQRHGLFFLDSLTSAKSIAYTTAEDMGLPAARNSLFLDADTEDAEVVGERLRRLVETAKRHGSAVGIGHPRRWTLEALQENEHYLNSAGVELVFLSEVVDGPGGDQR